MTETTHTDFFQHLEQQMPSLLIVDEFSSDLQMLQEVFSESYQILIANNAEAAHSLCRLKLPELVLIDLDMPELDGFELCRQFKADKTIASIPIIFLASRLNEDAELRALDEGAVDFIAKPFHNNVIQARVRTQITVKRQTELLQKMTFVDGLTGLYNRRFFDDRIESEFHRSRRTGSFLSILLINIDDFKSYNDHYGHEAGDECLQRIAQCIRKCCKRPGDFVARFSGSELACLLPDTSVINAFPFAQDLERHVRELAIGHAHSSVANVATISLGVVSRTGVEESSVFVELAKIALANAKEQGRARAWCALD